MSTEQLKLVVQSEGLSSVSKQLERLVDRLEDTEKEAKKTSKNFDSMRKTLVKVATATVVLTFFKKAVEHASDLAETTSKFNTVFKGVEGKANSMAQTLVDAYGQSETSSKKLLSNTGDLLTGLGMTADVAADLSFETQKLAVDLASFQNLQGGATQASEALTKGMLGERESLKTLGIVISETAVKEQLRGAGLEKLTGNELLAARARITLAMATKQSKNAINDFNRTQFDLANVSRRVQARLEDQSAQIGKNLVPSLSQLGVAFLEASKDGGVIMKALEGISKLAGMAIGAISTLINTFEALSREKNAETALKRQNFWLKKSREELKNITESGYANLANVKKAAAKDDIVAIQLLENYKVALNNAGKELKIAQRETKALENASKRLAEEEINAINETVAAREKAKAMETPKKKRLSANEEKKVLQQAVKARTAFLDFTRSSQEKEMAAEQEKFDLAFKHVKNDNLKREELERIHQANLSKIKERHRQEEQKKSLIAINDFLSSSGQIMGQVSSLFSQLAVNQNERLQQQQTAEETALSSRFERERLKIERTVQNESSKNKMLNKLEEQKKLDEEKLNKKFEKKRRKLARDQAVREKATAIIAATINTAQAATKALAQTGIFGGPAFAALMIALGGAQIALIASQPLPKAARGGLIKGSSGGTNITAGEGGKSEAVIPLENEEALEPIREAGLGGGVTINIGTFNAMGNAEEMAVTFDREVFKLIQNGNSLIAEELTA